MMIQPVSLSILLAVVIIILVVWLFGVPLWERMKVRFERTAFEQVIRQINSACAQLVIEAKATEKSDLRRWLGANPVACLEREAISGMVYLEEETSPDQQPKASWMYEVDTGSLRYRWRYSEQIISLGPEQDIVRYRLSAEFADSNQNEVLDDGEAINGLILKRVHPFKWLESSDY